MAPALVAPGPGEDAHPWDLAFKWTPVPGAVGYDLAIDVEGYAPYDKAGLACNPDASDACSRPENLPVDRDFAWEVKALGPTDLYDPNESDVAASPPLHTLLPESSPDAYSGMVWPATFQWDIVTGAESYHAWLYRQSEVAPFEYDELHWSDTNREETYVDLYLSPNEFTYRFDVQPVGPTVILGQPAQAELGALTSEFVQVDTTDAFVEMISPTLPASTCLAQDGSVEVSWKQVAGAGRYILRRFELDCPFPSGECVRGALVDEVTIDHDPMAPPQGGAFHGVRTEDFASFPGAFSTPLGAGSTFDVIGKPLEPGPNGEDWDSKCTGFNECNFSSGAFFVQPEAPEILEPDPGETFEGQDVVLQWQTTLANGGSFYLEAFNDDTCSVQGYSDTVNVGHSGGETHYPIHYGSSADNNTVSFRVRPTGIYAPCDQSPKWSDCRSFVINYECGGGGEPCCDGGACEGPLACVSGTCVSPAIKCGEEVQPGGGQTSFPESFVIDLDGTEGTFWLSYDMVVVKDRLEVREGAIKMSGDLLIDSAQISGVPGGCVSGQNGTFVTLPPGSSGSINVTVFPNCEGTPSTAWAFLVSCVDSGNYPQPPPED